MRHRLYYVYILSSHSRVIYVGVTSDLRKRVYQHRRRLITGFTKNYAVTDLVYFESVADVRSAIAREKEIKGWRREKKLRLIESTNTGWLDLAASWFD